MFTRYLETVLVIFKQHRSKVENHASQLVVLGGDTLKIVRRLAENENQADLDEPTTTTLATTNTNLARIWIIIVIYKFKKKGEKDKFISPGVGINPGPGIFILQRQSGHYTRPDAGKRTDP